jgi:alpha-beta hydrolase superfamily lysophospholipase
MVGHSTGGGEVTRYIGRHGTSRVAKAVLVDAVPPLVLKTDANPGGLPIGDSAVLSSKLVEDATLKVYEGAPHGLPNTHQDRLNADLLALIRE